MLFLRAGHSLASPVCGCSASRGGIPIPAKREPAEPLNRPHYFLVDERFWQRTPLLSCNRLLELLPVVQRELWLHEQSHVSVCVRPVNDFSVHCNIVLFKKTFCVEGAQATFSHNRLSTGTRSYPETLVRCGFENILFAEVYHPQERVLSQKVCCDAGFPAKFLWYAN